MRLVPGWTGFKHGEVCLTLVHIDDLTTKLDVHSD